MNIQELKLKSSEQLITQAEELGIENASTLRKQEILFAILKKVAEKEEITGCWCFAIIARWLWFLESHGVKLFAWSRRYLCQPKSNTKIWFKNWRYS